jgi:hypothetical protein
MMAWHHQHRRPDWRTLAGINIAEIWISDARWRLGSAIGWEFVLRRGLAHSSEGARAGEGDEQATTERGRDKRPQCAARSVGCYCFIFLLTQQCAAAAHNVRLTINALWGLDVSHIAEVGNG